MAKDRKTLIKNKLLSPFCQLYFVCQILLLILATTISNAEANNYIAPPSKAQQHAEDIRHFIADEEIKFLESGDQEFIALFKEQTAGITKGTAIIIPDIEQPLHQQAATSGLYEKLGNYGWNSLLMTMPDEQTINDKLMADQAAQPDESDNAKSDVIDNVETNDISETQNTQESTSQEEDSKEVNPNLQIKSSYVEPYYSESMLSEISKEINQRLNSAWQLASNSPGYFIVICQGKSCAWALDIMNSTRQLTPDAFIMLSAFMPDQTLNRQLAKNVGISDIAILDLYQTSDNRWVMTNAQQRKAQARKEFNVDFRQRKLSMGMHYHGQQSRILKEIYGFVSALGM